MKYSKVTLKDFAKSFGTTVDDLPEDCKRLIAGTDFNYKVLNIRERDKLVLGILKTIEGDSLTVSGPKRQSQWEKGWSENLQSFADSNYSIEVLIPKYIRSNQPIRLGFGYVMPRVANFEHYYIEAFRLWLFKKYLQDVDSVYDFGCGTGYNLTVLAKLFPDKKLYGMDWSLASQKMLNLIAKHYNMNIEAHSFDFYLPDENLRIADNSAIMTFAALEQVGSNYEAFLQFILKQSPAICINVECLSELYDEGNLVDYLAIKYHKRRNYLSGYLNRLRELEAEGAVTILKVQRLYFGSLYHEAYSYIVWRPKERRER